MAQASPTNMLLSQAAYRLEQLSRQYGLKKFKAPNEVVEIITKVMTAFEENAGKSLTEYNPIHMSEVPNSSVMNKFWDNLQADINILQQQIDLLKAGAISSHNFIKTEIQKASRENLKAQNKLKTLELYSNIDDPSLVYFGDTFITEDFIDRTYFSSSGKRMQILGNQSVGLGLATQRNALDNSPTLKILEGSNGMVGNNEEIVDPTQSSTAGSFVRYYFKSETYPANELDAVLDGEPTSWLEFEKYYVKSSDREAALGYNFNYKVTAQPQWAYLAPFVKENETIDWADGLGAGGTAGTLVLNFEIDLRSPRPVNMVTLLPFGLQDNINNPIKIKRVSTSVDRSVWKALGPQDTWLANSIDRKIVDINAENIIVGQGAWATDGKPVRFIKFEIEQPSSIQSNIGHLYYYIDDEDTEKSPGSRQLGPVPTVDEPGYYVDSSIGDLGELAQKMEYFVGRRWAIGIRDIGVVSNTYQETGSFVSTKFDVSGVIDRIALDADIEVPESWDQNADWVKFYVSPNNGIDWFQISRIQDDYMGVPEIIAFNDPTPNELREPGVAYYEVAGAVNSIRLKVEMKRPTNDEYGTPLLKPYTLKIKLRS